MTVRGDITRHIRVFEPRPGLLAFYDGRIAGYRYGTGANWVDDGAIALGIASYALVSGREALVYDTHVSPAHGRFVRAALSARGVDRFTVVLSHWHLDHVAGNAAFEDCEIIANEKTAAHLLAHRAAIEAGTHHGPPAISPLILPTRQFSGTLDLAVGGRTIRLVEADIHSDDATVIWLPEDRVLLAGDTLEDTITYVAEPSRLAFHLAGLERLWSLDPAAIYPNHGNPDIIARHGYDKTLIRATQQYVRTLLRFRNEPDLRAAPLKHLIAGPLQMGWISHFEPYEDVHRRNAEAVLAADA